MYPFLKEGVSGEATHYEIHRRICEVRPKSWTNMTMLFLTVLGFFTGHGDFYADSSCSLY